MSMPTIPRPNESAYLPTWESLGTDPWGMLPLNFPNTTSLPMPPASPQHNRGQTTANINAGDNAVEIALVRAKKLENHIEQVLKQLHQDRQGSETIDKIIRLRREESDLCEYLADLDEKHRRCKQPRESSQLHAPFQHELWTQDDDREIANGLIRLDQLFTEISSEVRHLQSTSDSSSATKTTDQLPSTRAPRQQDDDDTDLLPLPTYTGPLWKAAPSNSDLPADKKTAQHPDSDEIVTVDDRSHQRHKKNKQADDEVSDIAVGTASSSSSTESIDEETLAENDVEIDMRPASCMSGATKNRKDAFETYWKNYQDDVNDSPKKVMAWNALAGAVAYLSSFGVANTLARPIPVVGALVVPFVAAPLHTFVAGPLAGMLRAKTWTNPRLNEWLYHQRIKGRLAGDVHRTKTELQLKEKFPVKADDGSHTYVTAEKYLEKNQISNAARAQLRQTEDLPFTAFTASYVVRNSLLEVDRGLANPNAYWPPQTTPSPEAIPAPAPAPSGPLAPQPAPSSTLGGSAFITNKTAEGWASDFTLQHVFGSLAGALTMMVSQQRRETLAPETGGEAKITKPIHAWKLENDFYESYKRDLESALQNAKDGPYKTQLTDELQRVEKNLSITSQKTSFWKLFSYEVGLIWQEKRTAVAGDPEQPGKRIEAVADCFGKWVSLLPFAIAASLAQNLASGPASSRAAAVGLVATRMIAAPLFLIAPPGWMNRLDYAAWLRRTVGEHKGRRSAMLHEERTQTSSDESERSASPRRNIDVTTNVSGIVSDTNSQPGQDDTASDYIIPFDDD